MTSEFSVMINALQRICRVDLTSPLDKRGKPSRFIASLHGNIAGRSDTRIGLLDYNWNRSVGVDKIAQASRFVGATDLDGVLILANKFSKSAINQAIRINQIEEKQIILMKRGDLYQSGSVPASTHSAFKF